MKQSGLVKAIALLLLLILTWTFPLPVQALTCRDDNGHQICIVSIKRSAKYHWEYRAVLQVDGVQTPLGIYNCRDRFRVRQDGTTIPFSRDRAGDWLCDLFNNH